MAVHAAYCGCGAAVFDRLHRPVLVPSGRNSRPLCSLAVSNGAPGRGHEVLTHPAISGGGRGEQREDAVVVDQWMRDSVGEIVRNLDKAPLVVHVYSDGNKSTTFRTEKAEEEAVWRRIAERWERGMVPVPEGVIFAERLTAEDDGVTRAWGVLVQCRGGGVATCGAPTCYLLKTSLVGAGESGIGLSCTHFCLVKVKSFRESARSQLEDVWLV